MSTTNTKKATTVKRLLPIAAAAAALMLAAAAQGAAPGISGATSSTSGTDTFDLMAHDGYINQPDGNQVYTWGYGCNTQPTGFVPTTIAAPAGGCPNMQIPAPTLVVTEGDTVTVTLHNNLPASAGNTSILFPGFNVCVGNLTGASASSPGTCTASTTNPGVAGLLAQEAAPGGTVTYSFYAATPGTRSYYSGTQGDLQVEMGLYGAIIVLPKKVPATCTSGLPQSNLNAEAAHGEADFRLSQSAYDHPDTCYDREYLFQFSEMDLNIHRAAQAQVAAKTAACTAGTAGCSLEVPTEPYHPGYFLINGRSMPDDMDPNYDSPYPHQPYNGNPHMHPGEVVLLRVIGQGRWEHPFHEHANHVRILARDANPIIANATLNYTGSSPGVSTAAPINAQALAGMLMFTTDTFPGQSFDGLFYFTGKGLNWDLYGHNPSSTDKLATLACTPDANGYNTGAAAVSAMNYYEWCQDHNKPLEANPFGDVNSGGPMTLPNPNIFTNGAWYGGTPYLGPDATVRASSTLPAANGQNGASSGCIANGVLATTVNCTNLQPSNTQANPPNERGIAFMWHSHNEREITTDNVFPGGMLMMMLVDSREFQIDESK